MLVDIYELMCIYECTQSHAIVYTLGWRMEGRVGGHNMGWTGATGHDLTVPRLEIEHMIDYV